MMRKGCFIMLMLTLAFLSFATSPSRVVCKQDLFALCTAAQCDPIKGHHNTVLCHCEVETNFSLGNTCSRNSDSPAGKVIWSRYYPFKKYAVCNNDRPWAMCLDDPCIVPKDDPKHALCFCTLRSKEGPYAAVTDHYDSNTCSTGILSSAPMTTVLNGFEFVKNQQHQIPYFPSEQIN